jgi:hypothetical protein
MICKLVKVFHGVSQVGDSYYTAIPLTIQSLGQTPLSQSIKIQNPNKINFFLMWIWCGNMALGMEAKTRW